MSDKPEPFDDLVRRIIFVKVDNTLYSPEHPSIVAAAERITEAVRDMLIAAYEAGCSDVHANYQPHLSPEFGEAAHDYAAAALEGKAP